MNRDTIPDEDVAEPANGYLWDAARKANVSFRNYGEFVIQAKDSTWTTPKPWMAKNTAPHYPGWAYEFPDTFRAERWMDEFRQQVATRSMPGLTVMRLPADHTAGASEGLPTPKAWCADNDLALGRIVEAISRSPFWKSTLIIVVEDDAQDGPDHVDSHRAPLLVISAYNRPGVVHRFANTSDVVATIVQVLRLGSLSNFDRFGRPLADVFGATADTSAYVALMPTQSRFELNPKATTLGMLSRQLDLSEVDRADMDLFNRILWEQIKGPNRPYPSRAPVRI
jgi:hypothetical protein